MKIYRFNGLNVLQDTPEGFRAQVDLGGNSHFTVQDVWKTIKLGSIVHIDRYGRKWVLA